MAGTAGISEAQVQANSWETWDTRGEEILMLCLNDSKKRVF